jgi:hypothetical protein
VKLASHFFICCLFASIATAAEPISEKNWQNHPDVKKIRTIYSDIDAAEKIKKLEKQAKNCISDLGNRALSQELYADRNNIIRKYVVDGSSEDSRGRAEYYYDEKGILRFTYRLHATVNGTATEERIYFNEKGQHLYTDRKEKGPDVGSTGLPDAIENPRSDYMLTCSAYLGEVKGR